MDRLSRYEWPGNVRELENAMERAIILSSGETILFEDLPPYLQPSLSREESPSSSLEEVEKKLILDTLRAVKGNQTRAAELLGIHRNTLRRKLKRYHIQP